MSSTEIAVPADTPTRTVSVLPYPYWPINERWGYARSLAHAGDLIPAGLRVGTDIEATTARVFLVLETGAMLGLHPMAALQGIDVIEGTATISPQTMTALIRGAGHKLRMRESGTIRGGDYTVEWTLIRADDPDEPIVASWAIEDSVQAGLVELKGEPGAYTLLARSRNGNPLNHEKFPKDMTQWRALGRLARRGAADVTMGIGYFPEELEVVVNEEGMRRDLTPIEDPLIEEIKALDDKADMAEIWMREHPRLEDLEEWNGEGDASRRVPTVVWTERVEAEFTAHLSTLTKDSRPPKDGGPGHTGVPEIDGPPSEASQAPRDGVETAPDGETPAETAPESATEAQSAVPDALNGLADEVSVAHGGETIDEQRDREAREFEAQSAREFAEQQTPPPADGGLFDASALHKGPSRP